MFVIFLSAGYFRSANCRRELYAALLANKPIVALREDDKAKGGASRAELEDECLESCGERGGEVVEKVFAEEPTVWVRVSEFQNESLKAVAYHLLRAMPAYAAVEWLQGPEDLMIPGELGPLSFKMPMTLLVCVQNEGALAVARELHDAATEEQTRSSTRSTRSRQSRDSTDDTSQASRRAERSCFQEMSITVCDGAEELPAGLQLLKLAGVQPIAVLCVSQCLNPTFFPFPNPSQQHTRQWPKLHMCTPRRLYLNKDTFLDLGGRTADFMRLAIRKGLPLAMLHEQSPHQGGVPFRTFSEQTPTDLVQKHLMYSTGERF